MSMNGSIVDGSDEVIVAGFPTGSAYTGSPIHFDVLLSDTIDSTQPSIYTHDGVICVRDGEMTVCMSLVTAVKRGLGVVVVMGEYLLANSLAIRQFVEDVGIRGTPWVFVSKSKI